MDNPKKAREYIVAKSNELIQKSRYGLTLNQNKAVSYILSKIKRDDVPDTIYEFNCNEFISIMKLKKNSYSDIRTMLQNIADQSMFVTNDEGIEVLVRWLNVVRMDPRSGKILVKIHEDMAPYVFKLLEKREEDNTKFFTSFQLKDIALMSHKYSPRIYELIKSYVVNNTRWKFELGTGSEYDLYPKIVTADPETGEPIIPKNWSRWSLFERDVLKPAKEEINAYCPIQIDYKGTKVDLSGKKRSKICAVEFVMVNKTEGQIKEVNEKIDKEYEKIDADQTFQQLSFEDFFKAQEEALEKDRKLKEQERIEDEAASENVISENEEVEVIEDERIIDELEQQKRELEIRQSTSTCPYYLLEFSEFSDEQIELLYKVCLEHIGRGIFSIRKKNLPFREDWAVDYTRWYYDKILATSEETRTSLFRRLLDSLKNDYDNQAELINVKWANDPAINPDYDD